MVMSSGRVESLLIVNISTCCMVLQEKQCFMRMVAFLCKYPQTVSL